MQETMTVMLTTRRGATPEAVEIPRRVGQVKVGELLGEGTGGAVFTGYDEALNRRVAVKVLHRQVSSAAQASVAQLVAGVRSAASVKHPNIVTVHAVEMIEDMPVIVMEYVDGVSLQEVQRRVGALELPLALFVMRDVIAAVDSLHQANVVHRDLKPANILFDREGHAHVCDFGLACEFDLTRFRSGAENIGGSPLYMAPEMFDGHVSPQSDVYALGVMLIELLTGQPPFVADTIEQMADAHRTAEAPLHLLEQRNVPEELCEIIARALHKQRILRFKTAGRLLRALEAFETETGSELLQQKLARIVTAGPGEQKPQDAREPGGSGAMTTFDLIAERAAKKRGERGE